MLEKRIQNFMLDHVKKSSETSVSALQTNPEDLTLNYQSSETSNRLHTKNNGNKFPLYALANLSYMCIIETCKCTSEGDVGR